MIRAMTKYASIGVLNTGIHWLLFYAFLTFVTNEQYVANFGAFCIAVTFSFFANAKWTFKSEASTVKYLLFVVFMGLIAASTGWSGDKLSLDPILTLITFSLLSLIIGFIYSRFFVFKDSK